MNTNNSISNLRKSISKNKVNNTSNSNNNSKSTNSTDSILSFMTSKKQSNNKPSNMKPINNKPINNKPINNKPINNKALNTNPSTNIPVQSNTSNSSSNSILNIFFLIFTIVMIYLIIKISYYIYLGDCKKINLFDYLFSFEINPCKQGQESQQAIIPRRREVFHISNQIYTYEEAICKARSYGVELATKQQMINAYNTGANWCSYGWCDGGMAYYPVQQRYFEKNVLARFKCRKPGLNGGVFNRQLKLGINCYGVKPTGAIPTGPPRRERKDFCERRGVKELTSINPADDIASFNKRQWSMYN